MAQPYDEQGGDQRPGTTHTRVFLRPIGSPMPLGFAGLAVATMTLAGVELGWVPTAESHEVAWVLIVFAFPLQVVSAVLGFLARDTVVGAGIGVQSGAWLAIGVITLTSPPGSRSLALSLFLFLAAAALAPSVLTASLSKGIVALVMFGTAVRWVLTGVFERLGTAPWKAVTGWAGLALCVVALYAAVALELEDQRRRTILPTFRIGQGRKALEAGFPGEVQRVQHEAGVRQQL